MEKQEGKLLKYTYIILTAISCLSIYDIDRWTKLKLAHVLFVGIAVLHFCLIFKADKLKKLGKLTWQYSVFLIGLLLISVTINIITQTDTTTILQGIVKIAYQFIAVFVAISALYLFDDQAVDYTFWGFALFNFIAILLALKTYGFSNAAWSIQKFITGGGDADGFMKALELHDATFAFGLFLIYFAIKGIKTHKKEFIIGVFFFLTGYKRIGLGGFAAAVAFILLIKNMKRPAAKVVARILMIGFFVAGFCHIVLIRTGIFQELMDTLHIDMMGRQNLFKYIEDFYTISPKFVGHGFDSIRLILAQAGDVKVNNTYISRMGAIHSDYLRMYIELGFWGFMFWGWYLFVFMPKKMEEYNWNAFVAYTACTLYLAITYFTDNTAMFFLTTIVYKLIPGEFAIKQPWGKGENNVFQGSKTLPWEV